MLTNFLFQNAQQCFAFNLQINFQKGLFELNHRASIPIKSDLKYTREFFVTENGEIIKIAAIVTENPYILKQLKNDPRFKPENSFLRTKTTQIFKKKKTQKNTVSKDYLETGS